MAVRGDYAGLMPEYYDESRLSDFVFSAPFPGGPVALYKRRGEAISYPGPPLGMQSQPQLDAIQRGREPHRR